MNFLNEQLNIDQLPSLSALKYVGLEKDYLKVLFFSRLIPVVMFSLFFVIFILFKPFEISAVYLWIIGISLELLLLVFLLITPAVFRVKKYAIRSRDIIFNSGLIYQNTTIVPFNRVQHVEIKNGPIDRLFGLSRLKVYTAGGSQSDLVIPGLNANTAARLKEMIILKTSLDEEE
jgi:membrane protein YdbS with pleckstrin-like domain